MRALSIDIGIKNLALYIEDFDVHKLLTMKMKRRSDNFDKNHNPTKEYSSKLKQVYLNGKCVYIDLIDISGGMSGKFVTDEILIRLYSWLSEKTSLFNTCDFVMIEQQMNSRFKKNTSAQHIQHHIHSWFIFMKKVPVIIYPSKNKSDILGCPFKFMDAKGKYAKKTKPQLKEWSKKLGLSILNKRNDEESLFKVLALKKQDDVMDTLIQLQSFKIKLFVFKETSMYAKK